MKQINTIITLSILSSSLLLGATPNIGDVVKQVQPPKEVTQQKETPLVEIGGAKNMLLLWQKIQAVKPFLLKALK